MLAASNLFLDMLGMVLAQARRAAPSASAPRPGVIAHAPYGGGIGDAQPVQYAALISNWD
ncbi:hypothetical protein CIT31_30520 [Mesorhizobium wenxiniae]|uniref:Uncharacterized protein n=1 Tax=Mesorhizobium wenxiniae TaxID=2014805 RepID=A0A271K750_9HYPH|nr:hypothetical protein CIT31_30520 [Mesorhizobium wenxiniae]